MKALLHLLSVSFLVIVVSGCADHMLSADSNQSSPGHSTVINRSDAPTQGKLRHPQVLEDAISTKHGDVANKYGAQNANLFVAFAEYEADGVTRRVLDSYGVTRRILEEYGVTRRVLEEYGVTRRVLEEYGVTRRVMEEYGGLTWELLEAYGVTRRILDDYGVTRRDLEDYAEAYDPEIEVRVRINHARPGFTIAFVADFLDTFLDEIADDPDIEFVEPDVELEGAPLYLKNGEHHPKQMLPWNLADIDGLWADYDKEAVDVFILDSGVFDRDLNVVEAKDFTMLFQNRNEEMWDDSDVIDMPFFDPGEMGDPMDYNGHGTHGAGTIGAKDNDDGIKGVAPEARIHSLKVLTDNGRTDITTVVSAIDYVTDFKQQNPTQPVVANMSLGMDLGSTAYNVLDEAVKRAVDFGVVMVVSAGNDFADASTYSPAHVYEAITVGAHDRFGELADFSNHGPAVDILAPGDQVVSLTHLESEADNDDNILLSGTSSAAPHVAGAAALYLALHPYASPSDVKQALINAAEARITETPSNTTNRALSVAFADDGGTRDFEVTKAEWNSETHKIKVEGKGPRLDEVTIWNVGRGVEMATVVTKDNGEWKYELAYPTHTPCVVRVDYLGGTLDAASETHSVAFAPGSCDPIVSIDKAEWDEDDEELLIKGDAVEGTTVVITDTQLGTTLATIVADDDDEFEFVTTALDLPPCRVSANNGLSTAEAVVDDVDEDDCSAGMGLEVQTVVTKAEYDEAKDKLKVEGEGTGMITFKGSASGSVIGTDEADNNGRFKLDISAPSVIPCEVEVVSATGSTATFAVTRKGSTSAPSNCERSLVVEESKWEASHERLVVKGRGLFHNEVTLRDMRTNSVIATATTDHQGKFEFEFEGLASIPCAVIVESQEADFRSLEPGIENAAYNCEVDLVFNLLQYTGIYDRLSAGGIATAGSVVTLYNPDTGVAIADATVSDDRTWRKDMNLSESGAPPCRVEARAANGDVLEATVSPLSGCDPNFVYVPVEEVLEQNPYSFISLSKAQWNGGNSTLLVQGDAYEFMTITVTNPVTGEELGAMTNDDTDQFSLTIDIPGTIPCTIEAELDGRVALRDVQNRPLNCDDGAHISEAKWNQGNLELDVWGPPNSTLTLFSAGDGRQVGSLELDASGNFEDDFSSLLFVPCELRAETEGGLSHTLQVDGAPVFCDATAWLDIEKIEWRANDNELKFQGEGYDGYGKAESTVTFWTNGQQFHSEITDDGEFRFELEGSNYEPGCQVEIRIDGDANTTGVSVFFDVDGVCGN